MNSFFVKQEKVVPKIYAYKQKGYDGYLKIGYTTRDVNVRISEQFPVLGPEKEMYDIVFEKPAIRQDGSTFTDKDIHKLLIKEGVKNPNGEWFICDEKKLTDAYFKVWKNVYDINSNRNLTFKMRDEQQEAVELTKNYFIKNKNEQKIKFLWNAKMRFGKTFAAYKFIQEMGYNKVLVVSFKPTVQTAWKEDLEKHVDFKDFIYIYNKEKDILEKQIKANSGKKIVCFSSFQDLLGKNKIGAIKIKNEWIHKEKWDLVIIDEYHFGAWREKSKDLFSEKDDVVKSFEIMDGFQKDEIPIKCKNYLYLSGTPFRAINNGEFLDDQIFNWTYIDEQKKKQEYSSQDNNPYKSLPKMIMLTYQLPDDLKEIAIKDEFNEFSLNEFFKASFNEETKSYEFKHRDYVKKFIDFITGKYHYNIEENLKKVNDKKSPLPFVDEILLNNLSHTFWLLPDVASCYTMKELLEQNLIFKDYKIILAAGKKSKSGDDLLEEIYENMGNPLETKTITLSCQKLTTGVTIRPWSGILMLRTLNSPETYFQAAFRIQNAWTYKNDLVDSLEEKIYKSECYVFDFDPNRALKQIAEYCNNTNTNNESVEKKVEEFIKFLPILTYTDMNYMQVANATQILDFSVLNTTYNMLVRKWESALLVNVDNDTLKRIYNNDKALGILSKIEGFRNLNKDISLVISRSETIKKLKEKSIDSGELTDDEKKSLKEEKKRETSERQKIQKKLIKFATRIPIFMYLTDFREECLKDVITEIEPELFERVTGITIQDFDLLVSLNIFNDKIMNEAIYAFRRYEDSSLSYSGIDKHTSKRIGLFNTVIYESRE